ncbi:MAG: peptidoglycan DD-metalloendopeptidase family protein [Magnetococcales bacterium]|nr:peptidoglycan DD-metalloendopeptidase family protein [Magnetococcales bacterium]
MFAFPVQASRQPAPDELTRSKAQLQTITKRLKSERSALKNANKQEKSLLDEVDDLDRQLNQGRERLDKFSDKIADEEKLLTQLKKSVSQNEIAVDEQRDALASHLRLMYGLGEQGALKLALSNGDAVKTQRGLRYFTYLIRARSRHFLAFRTALDELNSSIEQRKASLETLRNLEQQLAQEQKEWHKRREARVALLKRVRKEKGLHRKKLKELKKAQEALTQFVSKLEDAVEKDQAVMIARDDSFGHITDRKGKLFRPVPIRPRSRPPGLFFPASASTPVRSIFRGQVVYADWFRGYGLLLILGHGDHVYSLYGHNQKLLVMQGDWVEEGESIAKAGDTGSLDDAAGLYFEIRSGGKTSNAKKWLSSRQFKN